MNNIKSSYYYYGVTPKAFSELPYEQALKRKIELGRKHLHYLIELNDRLHTDFTFEEATNNVEYNLYLVLDNWINDVLKAIEFNERLLYEVEKDIEVYPKEVECLLDTITDTTKIYN